MLHPDLVGRHVVFFSWRDTRNPEGGGAEIYLEKVAAGLVARGLRITIFCAAHGGAPSRETRDGIQFVRQGSKMGVYIWGMLRLATGRFGHVDAVVDVQNGLPFFTRLVTRRPVVLLTHHVHREQWPVVYPGLVGRVGWWIESRFSPWLYRNCQYVAVSQATREELAGLGVDPSRIAVVHNGTDPVTASHGAKSHQPSLCVVGRLVPHKQVEHAIDAWAELRHQLPELTLTIVGSGWWADALEEYAAVHGAEGLRFTGHLSEEEKGLVYAQSWVMALPSLKEGWGLVVGEAAMHGTPTVAYRSAGGTRESIDDGVSGLLVNDQAGFTEALRALLTDATRRRELADGARELSHRFTWDHAQGSFAQVLDVACHGRVEASQDPDEALEEECGERSD